MVRDALTPHVFPVVKLLQLSRSELVDLVREQMKTNPFIGTHADAIDADRSVPAPDVIVRQDGDAYIVVAPDDEALRLAVRSLPMTSAEHEDQRNAAEWLVRGIELRRQTIVRIAGSIMRLERAFLDEGVSRLSPLGLDEVAEHARVHASTVLRATRGKYVQTPRGVFELRIFLRDDDRRAVPAASKRERPGFDLAFEGFAGRRHRRLWIDGNLLHLDDRGASSVAPSHDAWERFWSRAEELGVFGWRSCDGVMDGSPWRLMLARGSKRLAIAGNGFEEHAPPGMRDLMLALHELCDGRLFDPRELATLRMRFLLHIEVYEPPPGPELVYLRAMAERLGRVLSAHRAPHELLHYSTRPDRLGVTFLLESASFVDEGGAATLLAELQEPSAVVRLHDMSTGVTREAAPHAAPAG